MPERRALQRELASLICLFYVAEFSNAAVPSRALLWFVLQAAGYFWKRRLVGAASTLLDGR